MAQLLNRNGCCSGMESAFVTILPDLRQAHFTHKPKETAFGNRLPNNAVSILDISQYIVEVSQAEMFAVAIKILQQFLVLSRIYTGLVGVMDDLNSKTFTRWRLILVAMVIGHWIRCNWMPEQLRLERTLDYLYNRV